jgi:hypothetical protein
MGNRISASARSLTVNKRDQREKNNAQSDLTYISISDWDNRGEVLNRKDNISGNLEWGWLLVREGSKRLSLSDAIQ